MCIEINCTAKDESIKKYLLEHSIQEFINHAIDKFRMPLRCFRYTRETPGGNTREILRIEAYTEGSLVFYFKAIANHYGSDFTDFINLYLKASDGVIDCVVYENNNKNSHNICITFETLSDYLGRDPFNPLYR